MAASNDNPLQKKAALTATEFTPLESTGTRQRISVSTSHLALGSLVIIAALILTFLFVARAVIVRSDPHNAKLDIDGISFNIGNNFLLLPGDYRVSALAEGYFPLDQSFTVTKEKPQEIQLKLAPLPGKLELSSELDEIEVYIDDQATGSAPGIIEGISRGLHKIQFSKHRYFTHQQEIEIEGLGRTQSLTVSLEPAWGQMQFNSVPTGAELYIDNQLMGKTPLQTEVLETGNLLKLAAVGYKTLEQEVSIRAGTTETWPLIELTVADGFLQISSSPSGASITIDKEFKGITPLTAPLSPLNSHQLEVFLEGYQKAIRRVNIEPEQQTSLAVDLVPIIGHIQLTIDPQDAEVVVDGSVQKHGSQTLALTAKEHGIIIRKTGYEAQAMNVTPRPGHQQSLDVKLLTIEQAYWASRPPRITSPVGSALKLFRPDGAFTMGAPRRQPGRRANEVERNVRLERPFYIGVYEVTNAEFRLWKEEHSSRAIRAQTLDMDDQPVANISWQEAALFCNWLSRRAGLPLFYLEENGLVTGFSVDSHGYRLPTEAEWAWAAKINLDGESMMFPWGTDLYPPTQTTGNYADQSAAKFLGFTMSNYNDGYPVSATIGSFEPNSKGLYDMSGNVAEWVNDYYDIRPSHGEPEPDPMGPATGNRHVIRGASWALGSRSELRLSYREAGADSRMDIGFRIARYVDKMDIKP
jgi:formylglycine-generating enzyme required for sulfatase activity